METSEKIIKEEKITYPKISPYINLFLFLIGFIGLDILSLIAGEFMIVVVRAIAKTPVLAYANSIDYLNDVNVLRYMLAFTILTPAITILFPAFKKAFKLKRTWVRGISYGLLVLVATSAYSFIVNIITHNSVSDNANQSAVVSVVSAYPVVSFLWIPFLGPIVEELTYRVGLFDGIRKINRPLAYIVVALVFGFIHFDFQSADITNEFLNLPSYCIAGLLFSYAYDRDGAPASIIAHVTNNLVSFIGIIITAYL